MSWRNAAFVALLLASLATAARLRARSTGRGHRPARRSLVAEQVSALPAQRPASSTCTPSAWPATAPRTCSATRPNTSPRWRGRACTCAACSPGRNPGSVGKRPRRWRACLTPGDAVACIARRMEARGHPAFYLTMARLRHDHELALFSALRRGRAGPGRPALQQATRSASATASSPFPPAIRRLHPAPARRRHADHDRRARPPSFGCGADSPATFFVAWLVEGLNRTIDFAEAFRHAQAGSGRGKDSKATNPRTRRSRKANRIAKRLADWRSHTTPGPVVAYPWPLDDLDHPPPDAGGRTMRRRRDQGVAARTAASTVPSSTRASAARTSPSSARSRSGRRCVRGSPHARRPRRGPDAPRLRPCARANQAPARRSSVPAPAPCRGRRPWPARGARPRSRPSRHGPQRSPRSGWNRRWPASRGLARSLTMAAAVYCDHVPDSVPSSLPTRSPTGRRWSPGP